MKKLLFLLLTLIIISCQKPIDGIDFTLSNNLPIVQANINGLPVLLLVDSGASVSLIDTSTAEILLFDRDYDIPVTQGIGVGGTSYIYGIKGVILTHNGDTLNVNFRGTDLSNFRKNNGIIGIIGSDFLSENHLVVDFKHKKLRKSDIE